MGNPTIIINVAPFWAYPTRMTTPAHRIARQTGDGRSFTACGRELYSAPLTVVERDHESALTPRVACAMCRAKE